MVKYYITELGLKDFKENKDKYKIPTIENKIMIMLSNGVGYRRDAIIENVLLDSRLKRYSKGYVAIGINRLLEKGFIKEVGV